MKQLVRQENTKLIICYQNGVLTIPTTKMVLKLMQVSSAWTIFFSKISTFIQMTCFLQLGKPHGFIKTKGECQILRISHQTKHLQKIPKTPVAPNNAKMSCHVQYDCKL